MRTARSSANKPSPSLSEKATPLPPCSMHWRSCARTHLPNYGSARSNKYWNGRLRAGGPMCLQTDDCLRFNDSSDAVVENLRSMQIIQSSVSDYGAFETPGP